MTWLFKDWPVASPSRIVGRGLSARHLVLGANEGGGAGDGQAQGHDRVGDQGVQHPVHVEGHFRIPFLGVGAEGIPVAMSMWTTLR